jgi:hypothetical protein
MSVTLSIESNISLADIQAAQQDGLSVVRTAHIGNLRDYNLAIASMGIPMQLVDHTIVAQQPGEPGDKNYLPGSIVTEQAIKPLHIDHIGGLALQTQAINEETGQLEYLDQLHTNKLRVAFPDTPIATNTEYIRRSESISGEVIAIAATVSPELFTRTVESDGSVHRVAEGSVTHLIPSYGVLQLNHDPHHDRGVLIPNEVDIVLGFVVEALTHGGDMQLHLSGPDFCNSSKDKDFQKIINALYEAVRSQASFGSQLPEVLHVKIIPATAARFVAAPGQGDTLQQIFDVLAQDESLDEEKRVFFALHSDRSDEAARFIQETRATRHEISHVLGELALRSSGLFIGPREAPFLSQYDVLSAGGIYIQSQNIHLSMHELELVHHRLERVRGQAIRETTS